MFQGGHLTTDYLKNEDRIIYDSLERKGDTFDF